ncbi:unnamed protein product [Linum trigynum]|uniref:Uncharacterized protein n=1 Tax=Linum trigynum TaxID=586398 RepID=A0AAV2GF64_9ROSI
MSLDTVLVVLVFQPFPRESRALTPAKQLRHLLLCTISGTFFASQPPSHPSNTSNTPEKRPQSIEEKPYKIWGKLKSRKSTPSSSNGCSNPSVVDDLKAANVPGDVEKKESAMVVQGSIFVGQRRLKKSPSPRGIDIALSVFPASRVAEGLHQRRIEGPMLE